MKNNQGLQDVPLGIDLSATAENPSGALAGIVGSPRVPAGIFLLVPPRIILGLPPGSRVPLGISLGITLDYHPGLPEVPMEISLSVQLQQFL